jgi:hypothetical protein
LIFELPPTPWSLGNTDILYPCGRQPLKQLPDFIINMVSNLAGEITGLYAGNWISALIDAIKLVDEIFSAEIEEAADIVIGSAGVIPAILTSIRHPN